MEEPHQVEPHQVEPHQVEPHQVEPHQVEPHQVESRTVQKIETKENESPRGEYEVDLDSAKIKVTNKEDQRRLIELRKELKLLRGELKELRSQQRISTIQSLLYRHNIDDRLLDEVTTYIDKKADSDLKVDGEPLEKYVEKYIQSKNLTKKSPLLSQLNKIGQQPYNKKTPAESIRVGLNRLLQK